MFEEFHYDSGRGPAKQLQIDHGAAPAELSILIAAAIPEPLDQKAIAAGPTPPETPKWPWTEEGFYARLTEARELLSAGPRGDQTQVASSMR